MDLTGAQIPCPHGLSSGHHHPAVSASDPGPEPNGVTHAYAYNSLNRLTNLVIRNPQSAIINSFAYTLGAAGNRTSLTELSGRSAAYTYDALYRLVDETVSNDPSTINGSVGYTYDTVGNRKSRASTLPGVVSTNQTYTVNDWLVGDTVDANGNTTASTKGTDGYDFENRLISRQTTLNNQPTTINLVYDGDGNRVRKTVNGVTTLYVVDDRNPTGYAQVLEEHVFQLSGAPSLRRVYTYGHDLISQDQVWGGQWVLSFYGYDGHGSVRQLTDVFGAVTDAYDYDAFGVQLEQLVWNPATSQWEPLSTQNAQHATPNPYRYTGEQWDADLGFYYLRARYSNPETGRFWTMDSYEGQGSDPLTLHKYLYCHANPVNGIDPSGHENLASLSFSMGMVSTLNSHIAHGAHAALVGARALFGADEFVNNIIYGLDVYSTVGDTIGQVALGGAALIGGMKLVGIMKTFMTGPAAKAFIARFTRILSRMGKANGTANEGGNCAQVAVAFIKAHLRQDANVDFSALKGMSMLEIEEALGMQNKWSQHYSSPVQAEKELVDALRQKGDGAAALIFGEWKGGGGGHSWNAVLENGSVKYYDLSKAGTETGATAAEKLATGYRGFSFLVFGPP